MRILAVDDDLLILDLLKGCLTKENRYDLTCCETSEEALRLIELDVTHFDCFLLDIMMPGVDGIELCDQLRQTRRYRTTPILMITASREPDLMERAFYAGATDFISKPLEGIELGARINSAAMLNDSLHRERAARHSLAELTEKSRLRFEEEVSLDGTGVTTLLAMENALLRMSAGCYAMTLFSIDISGLRGIHKAVTPPQFRHHLEAVATAAMAAAGDRTCKLAYTGSGRFVGAMIGRARLDKHAMLDRLTAQLDDAWDPSASGALLAPKIQLNTVSDQRLWSGLSACDRLREHLESSDFTPRVQKAQEDKLFARFDARMNEAD